MPSIAHHRPVICLLAGVMGYQNIRIEGDAWTADLTFCFAAPGTAAVSSTLIKNQARGDVDRLGTSAASAVIDVRLAAIPGDFRATANEAFDATCMRKLHDLGRDQAAKGNPWSRTTR
jgi:hypothetical protein